MKYFLKILVFCILQFDFFAAGGACAFLDNCASTKAFNLSHAYVSYSYDSDAVYCNPAFLSKQKKLDIAFSNFTTYETNYNILQAAWENFGIGWGAAYFNANINGFQVVTDKPQDQYFSYNATAYLFASALKILPQVSLGLTLKEIYEKAYLNSAHGTSLDLGLLYQPFTNLYLGITAFNISNSKMFWDTQNTDSLPSFLKLGLTLFDEKYAFLAGFSFKENTQKALNLGLDYYLSKYLSLRMGWQENNLSLGMGLILDKLYLDTMWMKASKDFLDDIFRLTLGVKF